MEVNRGAPAIAEGDIRIAASPEVVWDVLSDVDRWPSWSPDIKAARLEGPLASGSTFRWRSGGTSLVSVLRVVDPPRELGWTGTTLGIRAVHVFRLNPEDGGTWVRSEESWEGLLPRFLKGYSRKAIDRGIANWLRLLKDEAERRAGV